MGERTCSRIRESGGDAIFIKADVGDSAQVKDAVRKTVLEFGGLTCLVNCAARYSSGMAKNVAEISEEEWEKTLNVNLGGYFRFAKYSIPEILKSGGGTVINISSAGSFRSLPNFSVYSVSKAAIDALTRCLAVDFAPRIRTNSVCPGFVRIANSEKGRKGAELDGWLAGIAKEYPMRRVCSVDEVASAVSFLAGDEAAYINGQSIIVDGGRSISDSHDF